MDWSAASRVFELDLLLEMILDLAMHDKKELVVPNVHTCRLVNKSWLQAVSRVFIRAHEPLFQFYLLSAAESSTLNAGKTLVQFRGSLTTSLCEVTPSHAIIANDAVFAPEQYQKFTDCLVNCGKGLLKLELALTSHQEPIQLPNISLPKLRTFSLLLDRVPFHTIESVNDKIHFVQSIFDCSANLQSFEFKSTRLDDQVSNMLNHLTFPLSLTKLDLKCILNDTNLATLARIALPNLKTLELQVNQLPFQDNLITRLLEKFQETLEHFRVTESSRQSDQKSPSTFQLPLMEKLQSLKIETGFLELAENLNVQNRVPVLSSIVFAKQTHSMFHNWIDNSCYHTVTTLSVSLVEDNYRLSNQQYEPRSFDLQTMQALKKAFPNLLKLKIALHSTDKRVAQFIFSEFGKLQRLCIQADVTRQMYSSAFWDSLLTGIPAERLLALRKRPLAGEDPKINTNSCIRELTDLHTLELDGFSRFYSIKPVISVISDLAFSYALFRMDKLSKLILKGMFLASPEMETEWKEQGRLFEDGSSEM